MIPQASSSRTTLSSHPDHHVVAHSISVRRLLSRLDKSELVSLVARWLSSSSPFHIPPMLSRRQPKPGEEQEASNLMLYHAILDLNEERRARSLDELRMLWTGPMADPKVPKARAMDRITDVDWPEGLSYGMIAELDLAHGADRRLARTWMAVKMEYDDDYDDHGKGYERLSEANIKTRLTTELGHYFEHHVYLQPRESTMGVNGAEQETWTDAFSYYRVVLAPIPTDVCGTGLHILHLARTPFLLVSGGLGRGLENREMALSAFAAAAGANTINYSLPASGTTTAKRLLGELNDRGEDVSGNRRTLGELKGKDPTALRQVLLHESGLMLADLDGKAAAAGVAGGGKARQMWSSATGGGSAGAEDGPLVAPTKRRREQDVYSLGIAPPTPPASATESDVVSLSSCSASARAVARERDSLTPVCQTPHESQCLAREAMTARMEARREATDLFGPKCEENLSTNTIGGKLKANGEDVLLPKIERIEYELHLGFPEMERYNTTNLPDMDDYNADPDKPKIKLRLEGTHVLAGLRKLVESGMDRRTKRLGTNGERRATERSKLDGLPGWMTEVRGTRVVVKLPAHEAGEADDSSRDM